MRFRVKKEEKGDGPDIAYTGHYWVIDCEMGEDGNLEFRRDSNSDSHIYSSKLVG